MSSRKLDPQLDVGPILLNLRPTLPSHRCRVGLGFKKIGPTSNSKIRSTGPENISYMCTVFPRKGSHLMFDNNFGKCGPIFKILSLVDL